MVTWIDGKQSKSYKGFVFYLRYGTFKIEITTLIPLLLIQILFYKLKIDIKEF